MTDAPFTETHRQQLARFKSKLHNSHSYFFEVEAIDAALAEIARLQGERDADKWIVMVMAQGKSWWRCYGPFASYEIAMAWTKANQYDNADERGVYPIQPAEAP